ncbi:ADP-ribosylation factor-like 4C [Crotalus adamanteus]|uniref:ADP-ribosylation factor-like 4C n=1 Tax=Crotalus adamanteus TaxID=8729 RepID=A0AAW1CAA2_CROAD
MNLAACLRLEGSEAIDLERRRRPLHSAETAGLRMCEVRSEASDGLTDALESRGRGELGWENAQEGGIYETELLRLPPIDSEDPHDAHMGTSDVRRERRAKEKHGGTREDRNSTTSPRPSLQIITRLPPRQIAAKGRLSFGRRLGDRGVLELISIASPPPSSVSRFLSCKIRIVPDLCGESGMVSEGLDSAGKTTVLYRLKFNEFVNTVPTIGFNTEKIKLSNGTAKGISCHFWDVGGQEKLRPLWKSYSRCTDGIIYVVDSVDVDRLEEAKTELHKVTKFAENQGTPLLVIANKQDLPKSLPVAEIEKQLALHELTPSTTYHIQPACAIIGEGLTEGMDRLYEMILKRRKSLKQKRKR